jgi:predicted CopG family antitoxin
MTQHLRNKHRSAVVKKEKHNVCEVCGKTITRRRPHVHVISDNNERKSAADVKAEAEEEKRIEITRNRRPHVHVISDDDEGKSAAEAQEEKAEAEEEKRIEKEVLKLKRKEEMQNLESEQLQETLKLKMFQKEKGQLLKQKLQIEQRMLQLKKSERLAIKSITDLKVSISKLRITDLKVSISKLTEKKL